MAEDKQMEYFSAQQMTKSSKAYGLEESILEKRQGLVSEGLQVGLVDMGSQSCSDIVDNEAHCSKTLEMKRLGMPSEDPSQVKNIAVSPENVIDNTKSTEIGSAGEDIGESIHKFDSKCIDGAHSLQEKKCQLGVEGSTNMPSGHAFSENRMNQEDTYETTHHFGSRYSVGQEERRHTLGIKETSSPLCSYITEQLHEPFYENSSFEHRMLPSPNVRMSHEAGSGLCPKHLESHETHCGSGSVSNQLTGLDHVKNVSVQVSTIVSDRLETESTGLQSNLEIGSTVLERIGFNGDSVVNEQLQVHIEKLTNGLSYDPSELQQENLTRNSNGSEHRDKRTSKRLKNMHTLRSSLDSNRVLRSRSKDNSKAESNDDVVKPYRVLRSRSKDSSKAESNDEVVKPYTGEEVKRKQRKETRAREAIADEFSRIRKNLSYMLNRISYERSLIDAYSGEGWKGLSLEKIKPEKELQRATSEIGKRKLRIRDLFQRIDSLCAEGKLPEALFDSEGMIDSEDIFCAKCGSKDLTADNDIILCDGACDRGFHQYCLEPPLHKEHIPPADQGWLCPGCDCKVDCMDLLNKSQGTNLSITDSWEKVFPEVAIAENDEDPNLGLPSDDSDDADYDPDAPQADEDQGDESVSDESGSNVASDKLGAALKDDCLGLPSEDSEDDDFDPDAPDSEKVKEESSSSDFTSDSEDFAATVGGVVDEVNYYGGGGRISSRNSFENEEIMKGELRSLMEGDADKDISVHMPGKRHVERLDYKKLYDEEFGGDKSSDSSDDEDWSDQFGGDKSSDSSDDEGWSDTVAPRKRKRGADKATLASNNGNFTSGDNIKHNKNGTELTPRRRTSNMMDSPGTSSITAKPRKSSSTPGLTGGRARSSTNRRLGEAITQRLQEAFKENHYPERAASEKLAEELGITTLQVRKWFGNARWSFNHPSGRKVTVSAKDMRMESPMPQPNTGLSGSATEMITDDAPSNGIPNAEPSGVASIPECIYKDVKDSEVGSPQTNKSYNSSLLRKRKEKGDNVVSGSDQVNQAQAIEDDSAKVSEPQASSRKQTRSKSKA
ncbi:homeobox protein HAT3.1 [Rhodamnia argentea]|uniref:Homeobox protein HAT3.1 n=1 Tax=Rhodamnia argentea TaxID=178133 RepID=A0A8B8R3F4_9MYRT|nr:homeobox protein HAT3.1 [Rhodamnia argentea]XP_048134508.1 homeobox protein HAT3.1 [Rhodamnia argentea]XP_048134510.1 homeobox protein HAT3.1 [Rhodamnia argentea]XP_048134511.1 homeobox protein HAT3.1 [Rhodamnia argentea]